MGDGSWLYNPVLHGLMAAAQYGLPLLVVVFNNKKYLSMRFNLTRAYPEGTYVASKSGYGVDLSAQPDAAAVAAACGAAGFTVTARPPSSTSTTSHPLVHRPDLLPHTRRPLFALAGDHDRRLRHS